MSSFGEQNGNLIDENQINAESKNSKLFLEKIINTAPTPIFTKDTKHRFTRINDACCTFFGIKREDIIGKTDHDFFPKIQADVCISQDKLVFDTGEEFINEEVLVDANGNTHTVIIRKTTFNSSDSDKTLIATIEDITQQRDYEDDLKKEKIRAEKATKSKSEFLANMSHEIRTPMNAIFGFLHLLGNTDLNDEQKDYLNEIQISSKLLLNIINDILDLSKIEAGKMAMEHIDFNMREIIDDIVNLSLPYSLSKNIKIYSDIAENIPLKLYGDPCKLKQILNNLISNSIKFTKEGEIVIKLEISEEKSDSVCLKFEVSDTGIGIPKDKLNLIFGSFNQADVSTTREYGGTGLGLSIVQKLINLMGGHISVESELGKGSVFSFTVKFDKIIDEPTNENSNNLSSFSKDDNNIELNKRYKLLLVEDNEINQKITVKVLSNSSFNCEVRSNGQEALEACREKDYDLILMDCQMPVMDGYEATKEIRNIELLKNTNGENQVRVPIIALTANALKEDVDKCLSVGMDDYVIKPIDVRNLINVIKKHLYK